MTAVQQRRRVLDAVRRRPDTASGVAERLLIKEEAAKGYLSTLRNLGKVRVESPNADGDATWAYIARDGFAAREGK